MSNQASNEWIHQRYTAIINALSIFGFIILNVLAFLLMKPSLPGILSGLQSIPNTINLLLISADLKPFLTFFKSPFVTLASAIVIISMLYHGAIGIKIIIEDYVPRPALQKLMIMTTFFITYSAIALCLLSVLKLHLQANL